MNIYLDIDGVLLVNERHAATGANEFLKAILSKYPDSIYWLTTHCWQGINRTKEVLAPVLNDESMKLIDQIKPTEWGDLKTDAINFAEPFLWFDDDLYPQEKLTLQEHDALSSWIGIDLHQNPSQLKDLITKLGLVA